MLNNGDQNSTCIALLNKRGINITDKNSVKAAASMSSGKVNYINGFKDYSGCILPSESLSTFSAGRNCQVANKYTLIPTKKGVLETNQSIENGKAIYPSSGCMYDLNPRINADPNTFMTDAGLVLDEQNKSILDSLNVQLNGLRGECDRLDQGIDRANRILLETKQKLSVQQSVCQGYMRALSILNNNISNVRQDLNINTIKLNELKITYQKSICIGQTMAEKCNKELRHCYVTEHCGYDGNWKDINALKQSNSRGAVTKLEGYISDLPKTISSLIIPPGIEVRVFDDSKFIGGDSIFIAPLNGNGIDKICLLNDKYNKNILQQDYLGNTTNINTTTDWNDKISSIRIRRKDKYQFIPSNVIESYINNNESVLSPLIIDDGYGRDSKLFYDPSVASSQKTGDNYLLPYDSYNSKKLGRGSLDMHITNQNSVESQFMRQKCAKQCTDNGGNCDAFIFNINDSSCDLIRSKGEPLFKMNGDATNVAYVKKTTKLIDNQLLPEGFYKQQCSINTGTYDGIILNMNCPNQTNQSINSSIRIAECKPNSITNNNGNLTCEPIYASGLNYKVYEGYFHDDINFIKNARILLADGGVKNGNNIRTFTNGAQLPDANFTVEWTGFFKAKEGGAYQFWTQSDDASYLWIGDTAMSGNSTTNNALVKVPGIHPMVTGTGRIDLIKDTYYPIRIIFGQYWGGYDLVFNFQPTGKNQTHAGEGYLFSTPEQIIKNFTPPVPPAPAPPPPPDCVVTIWKHYIGNEESSRLILTGNEKSKKFEGGLIPEASSMVIDSDKCVVILNDGNNNKITVNRNTENLNDFTRLTRLVNVRYKNTVEPRMLNWNDAVRSITIQRK